MKYDKCEVNKADMYPAHAKGGFCNSEIPAAGRAAKSAGAGMRYCPGCSTPLDSVLASRLVGCPRCYVIFRNEIRDLESFDDNLSSGTPVYAELIDEELNEPVRY